MVEQNGNESVRASRNAMRLPETTFLPIEGRFSETPLTYPSIIKTAMGLLREVHHDERRDNIS